MNSPANSPRRTVASVFENIITSTQTQRSIQPPPSPSAYFICPPSPQNQLSRVASSGQNYCRIQIANIPATPRQPNAMQMSTTVFNQTSQMALTVKPLSGNVQLCTTATANAPSMQGQGPMFLRPLPFKGALQIDQQSILQSLNSLEPLKLTEPRRRSTAPQLLHEQPLASDPQKLGMVTFAGIPRPSAISFRPSILGKSLRLREAQLHQVQFSQLPGLNFNHTSAETVHLTDLTESATNGYFAINPSRKRKPVASESLGTQGNGQIDHSSETNPSEMRNTNHIGRYRKEPTTTTGKKRKVNLDGGSERCMDVSNPTWNVEPNANVGGTSMTSAEDIEQSSSQGGNLSDWGKTRANLSVLAPRKSSYSNYMTPARFLIQIDMTFARNYSAFNNGIRFEVDRKLSHPNGIYVFDVYVFEKHNGTDFPPVKLQVTEDYPAEIPVFLDFRSIAQSVTNTKSRRRFELVVMSFKKKFSSFSTLWDSKLRIHTLTYLWSLALKEVVDTSQTSSDVKVPKKKVSMTKTLVSNTEPK